MLDRRARRRRDDAGPASSAQAGVNLDFAPVADVVPPGTDAGNAPIGQLHREYGHHPRRRRGPRRRPSSTGMRAGGVATTAKHFPGLGRVAANTDDAADVTDTVTTPHDPYLRPFARDLDDGVPFVMVSLATYTRIDPSSIAAFSLDRRSRASCARRSASTASSRPTASRPTPVKTVAPGERAHALPRGRRRPDRAGHALPPAIAMATGPRGRGRRGSGDREADRRRRPARAAREGGRRPCCACGA